LSCVLESREKKETIFLHNNLASRPYDIPKQKS
jgi:hypothetical protein